MTCRKQVKLKGGFEYTVRTARKGYKCFYCGKPINAGTVYIVMTLGGGWDNPRSDWGSRVMSLEKPAYTITEKHRSGQLVPIPGASPAMYRRLTVRECLRLQGFPDWWRFPEHVSVSKKYKLVGEAVPPILAYRLAVAVAGILKLETREPPRHEEWQLPYFERAFSDYLGDGC
jgi:site-specific DNA-cytosine methylase